MKRKLPQDAFAFYASLGPTRSYSAVAAHFRVDKTTVVRNAKRERWQEQIIEAEKRANARTQEKLVSTLDEMNERHLKVLRAVLGKALEALRATPLRSASEAVRAIDMCVKHERVILGEPAERSDVSVEAIIKREYERWMVGDDDDEPPRASGDADSLASSSTTPGALPSTGIDPGIDRALSTSTLEEDEEDDDGG